MDDFVLVTAGIFLIVAVCRLQPAFRLVLAQERLDPEDSANLGLVSPCIAGPSGRAV